MVRAGIHYTTQLDLGGCGFVGYNPVSTKIDFIAIREIYAP
jgi:hypothetical protein